MKLLNEYEMSEWAYNECFNGNDTPEIRKLITDSYYSYEYCRWIKDRDELWLKITDKEILKAYFEDHADRWNKKIEYRWVYYMNKCKKDKLKYRG